MGLFYDALSSSLTSDPLMAMSMGLMSAGMPGGNPALGFQQGWQNVQSQQQANQAAQLQKAQLDKYARDVQREQAAQDAMEEVLGQREQVATPFQADFMEGEEQAPTGLFNVSEGQTYGEQNPLLAASFRADPLGSLQKYRDEQLEAQFSTTDPLKPMVVGKGGSVYIPGQGFVQAPGGIGPGTPEFSDVLALKKQAQPRVNVFRDVARQGNAIYNLISQPGPYSDVASLVSAVKILDPGSVAREGEVQLPLAVQGLYDRLTSQIQKAQGQGFLSDNMREDIRKTIGTLMQQYQNSFNSLKQEYQPFQRDYGVSQEFVIGPDISWPAYTPGDAAAVPEPGALDDAMTKYGDTSRPPGRYGRNR